MDILAHVAYGVTVCSRTGLAGGAAGSGKRVWIADWTAWAAVFFGVLPDLVSMGPPFLAFWAGGRQGHFFRDFGGDDILVYRHMHSLLVALAVSGLLRIAWKPLFLPSLAWPLHLVMDAFTHGAGKYQTTLFYPLTTWSIDGVRWWEHPELVAGYWLLLPVAWFAIRSRRRRFRAGRSAG